MHDEQYLRESIELAREAVRSGNGGPFGALVVLNGEVIGRGQNCVISSHDPTAHAELEAIRDACRKLEHHQLEGAVIYCSCEPCPMCLGAIYWARPKAIFFAATKEYASNTGFDDSFIYEEIVKDPEKRKIPAQHIPLKERLDAFLDWENKTDKTEY